MSKSPFFSIGIPVYNSAPFLQRCIDSIYAQNFEDIEIIFVNDGSSDNSLDVINEFAKKDSRITVINRENDGPSSARNAVFYKATGKYLLLLDSDDILCDEAVNNAYNLIMENDYPDLVHAGFIRVVNGVETKVPAGNPPKEYFTDSISKDERWMKIWLDNKAIGQMSTKFIKREFLEKYGLAITSRLYAQEDNDFVFQLNRKADTIVYGDFYSYKYFKNRENSISTRWSYKAVATALSRWENFYVDIDFYKLTEETRKRIIEDKAEILTELRVGTLHFPAKRSKEECFKLIDLIDRYFGKDIRKLPINTGKTAVEKLAFVFYKIFGIKNGFKIMYKPFYHWLKFRKVIQ